jgi:hypothetical protein
VWLSVPSISCHGLETWWHDGALLRGSVEVDGTRQVVVVAYADEKEDANTQKICQPYIGGFGHH